MDSHELMTVEYNFLSNSEPVRCGQPPTMAWLELWEAAMEKVSPDCLKSLLALLIMPVVTVMSTSADALYSPRSATIFEKDLLAIGL